MAHTSDSVTYLTCTETAKLVRQALKAAWPGVKFSVRSNRYAGGASIDVKWTDGPTEYAVKRVTGLYCGATFDGMQDLKEYHQSLLADEHGDVREVHFGADFIFQRREVSAELLAAATGVMEGMGRRIRNHGVPCCACINWISEDMIGWFARTDVPHSAHGTCCSPECAARVEVRYGHIRPHGVRS